MQTHSGEWPSGCGQSNFTCTTDGHLNKHILIHSREKLFKVYHYQSQHSTQISPVIWRETSGSKLEKQILATKSHSSNDLFSSVVLLLQVIFISILFNVCVISELSMRSFAIDEPGSSVCALYATLLQAHFVCSLKLVLGNSRCSPFLSLATQVCWRDCLSPSWRSSHRPCSFVVMGSMKL